MGLFKNVASQKWIVFAFDETDNTAQTGDAANITAEISIDGAAGSAVGDTNPTELEDGYYVFDLTQAETNGDLLLIMPESSTANIQVVGVPGACWTREQTPDVNVTQISGDSTAADNLEAMYDGTGYNASNSTIGTVSTLTGHTAQTGDSFARLGAPAGASVSADIADIPTSLASGTAQGGTSSTIQLAASSAFADDELNGNIVKIVGGTGSGQSRRITDYTNSTDTATITPNWTTNPDATSVYEVVEGPHHEADFSSAESALAVVDGNVDAILVDTADMQPKLGTISDLGGGSTIGDNLSDMAGSTFASGTDSLEAIRDRGDAAWTTGAAGSGLSPLASGTAQGGTSSTIQLASGETFADDEHNGNVVKIVTGTGAGQSRVITDYTGATDTATVSPNWTTTPDNTSTYEIVPGSVNVTVVSSVAEDLPTATDLATVDTVVDGIQTDLSNGTDGLGAIKTAVDAIQTDLDNGTDGLGAIKTDTAAILADTADMQPKLGTVSDLGGGSTIAGNLSDMAGSTFSASTDSLEAIRDRGDSAWTTGSAGSGLTALASGTAQGGTASTIQFASGETFADDEMNGNIVKITAGTGAGQSRRITDYAGATDTATITPNWTTTPDNTSEYEVVQGQHNESDLSTLSSDIATVDTVVDGIQTDLSNGTDGLGAIKTDTAAILADTADMQPKLGTPAGADMSADIAAVKTDTAATLVDTNEIQGDLTDGGRLDLLIDAIKVVTDALGATAAARLALSAGQMIPFTVDTATNGHTPTTTVFQADDITEATADHYNGRIVIFTSGALAGQATDITDYEAVGGIGQFTVTATTEPPANNDTGIIV